MSDDLGTRIKENYERASNYTLPKRTFTIIRLDGCSFKTFTKKLNKPFDHRLVNAMAATAVSLCKQIMGVSFAYTQSDEISLLLTDFKKITSEAWFGGSVQKIASVSASMASVNFNSLWQKEMSESPLAYFDSRVFTISEPTEVENYFIWRNKDCEKNSINSAAQSMFSHKELHGKNLSEVKDMMFNLKNINWGDFYSEQEKNGTLVVRKDSSWGVEPGFQFTKDRERLKGLIPNYEEDNG